MVKDEIDALIEIEGYTSAKALLEASQSSSIDSATHCNMLRSRGGRI